MIRHQAVREHQHGNFNASMADGFEKGLVVVVFVKDLALTVASVKNVITNSANRSPSDT